MRFLPRQRPSDLPAARMPYRRALPLLGALLLAACGTPGPRPVKNYDPEEFGSTTTHTRSYAVTHGRTCEAARRALLSQGYLIAAATPEEVTGRKNFQPEGEVHLEVEFRVVCVDEQGGERGSIAFATAVQDRYELKKVNSSASVGVGAIGSVSVPFNASNDAMVKVASQTLTDEAFYERFFTLIERYIGNPHAPLSRAAEPPTLTESVTTPVVARPDLTPQTLAPQMPEPEAPAAPQNARATAQPLAPIAPLAPAATESDAAPGASSTPVQAEAAAPPASIPPAATSEVPHAPSAPALPEAAKASQAPQRVPQDAPLRPAAPWQAHQG